jgi:hypothetical protein
VADLADAVGASPPPEFDTLSGDHRAALATLVERAVRERSDLLDRAIEDSLRNIPGLLRGPIRRALGM